MAGAGRVLVGLLVAALVAATAPSTAAQGPTLVIDNGRLFDGTGAPVIEDGVVVIEGERIVAAGPASAVDVPAGASTVDAQGGLIMPGVIDNHTHVSTGWRVELQDHLTPWLEAGVTTLVDVGFPREGATLPGGLLVEDPVGLLRTLIDGLSERPPRTFLAGPILTAPGGYPETRGGTDALAAQPVEDAADARSRVARLIDEQGADLIKVAIEAGFGVDYDAPRLPVLPPETLAAIAEATHERGLRVRAHVTESGELRAALEAGFDGAAHTPTEEVADELLEEAAEAGMILVSTANIWGGDGRAAVQSNLTRYAALGGRVALGTDFPFQAGSEMPVREMEALVEGGLTPAEVLIAATKHGGEALGLGDELGTLEPGRLADVIVVDGDPLEDIADMAEVSVVVLGGEVIVGDVVQPPATATPSPEPPAATPSPTSTLVLPDVGDGPSGGVAAWAIGLAVGAGAVIAAGGALAARAKRGRRG